ncbi:anthranilate phosphoribosyltransferase [Falsibacillus albus]|uniref:Anthranilate phosphoribosyltransferase n=1 Tax=Falsibacillus albus TaxID=2478915 RepID=A0A3L7JZ15_9BACI|nr:anthranilate phosphoribosyltransferase [Falsibacillus albus]RLQ95369.1 anthranilate phosphoribosyltransferase [Falsibacillus albus]
MRTHLQKLADHESLTLAEMMDAAEYLFSDKVSDSEIAAFLMGLKTKGETTEEMSGLVSILREKAHQLHNVPVGVMDNCGTGGDGSHSFNISTTAAFVIAGAGIPVAKHGNRSVSSRTGSADVLENLGVSLQLSMQQTEEILEDNGIAFLFAPSIHPSLKRVMKIRNELKIPTMFNLIGPLTNPVTLDTQLVGIYRRDMLEKMAMALHQLGRRRGITVNGAGYMDEASLAGENHLVLVDDGELIPFKLSPEDVDLPQYDNEEIIGGNAADNASILKSVLKGESGAYRDTVILNAALGIFASGKARNVHEAIRLAKESIDSGAAIGKLEYLIDYSRQAERKVI